MPLQKLSLKPGVNRENTRYTNEGGWYESNLVRFRQGTPEKIGGWARISANTYLGICRSLWNWITLAGRNLLGVGTSAKFYIENGGAYYDVTPFRVTWLLSANPFTTIAGSKTVTVTDTNAGYKTGDTVIFYGATAVGGLTLNGEYQLTYASGTTYTIQASANASTGATGGGAAVYAAYQVNTGSGTVAALTGWGSGAWGASAWGADGAATAGSTLSALHLWNQVNWGQDLVYGPRGGALYYWSNAAGLVPTTVTISFASPAVVTMSSIPPFVDTQGIVLSTTGVLPAPLVPGVTYFVKTVVSNTFNLAATAGGAAIVTTNAGSGVHTILPNGVALTTAYGATEVPLAQNFFVVSDASRFLLCFGTNDVFQSMLDPMLVRWSDQGSLTQWSPAITNQAGSVRLSHGSKIVTAVQSRQEILVWTDQAMYSLQYLGPPYVWGNQILADSISIIGPNAAAMASGVAYWMGMDKFYMYDGRVATLNCDLRAYIYGNINLTQAEQCFAATNEGFNEVWFFYCSAASLTVDSYVVYNYLEKVWYFGALARSAWLDSGLRDRPIAATYVNNIVEQESGVDDNSGATPVAMDSYITSSQFDIGDGDHMAFVWRMLPDLTFRGSTEGLSPQVTFYLQPLKNSGSGYTTPASVAGPTADASAAVDGSVPARTAVSVDQFTGQVYIRVRGRQMSIKIACNTLGTQWQLGSPRIDTRPDGRR